MCVDRCVTESCSGHLVPVVAGGGEAVEQKDDVGASQSTVGIWFEGTREMCDVHQGKEACRNICMTRSLKSQIIENIFNKYLTDLVMYQTKIQKSLYLMRSAV